MSRIPVILKLLALTMALFSTTMLLPLALAWWTGDAGRFAFLAGLAVALGVSGSLWLATKDDARDLRIRDGFLLVTLAWVVLPLLAAVPLLVYYNQIGQPLGLSKAYFEAMSGLSTTGSTVLNHLDGLPHSINLWRATLVWVGGMGILVLAIAILPLLGVGGHQLFRAEPGPMKDEKLTPRIASTGKVLYAVYFIFSIACFLAYRVAGLSWFDAWCHMATTMGLGGFSTSDEGFLKFDSVAVEMVAMVFMVLAGINFATHFLAFRQRSLKAYLRCSQTVPYLLLLLGSGLFVTAFLYWKHVYGTWGEALRYGMFNTISVATTTGYANTDYTLWPLLAPLWMILLASFATSAGSTGGGIKLSRAILLVKQTRRELTRLLHPNVVAPVRLGRTPVGPEVIAGIMAFLLMYGLSIGMLTTLMLLSGLEPVTAFSAVFASINNLGPGMGDVGPMGNYAGLSDYQLWLCSFAMLIGRLELFTVLVLFTPEFWRR
ncbi:MAG: potassium transporter TrkG [Corticimicrobacter sp.]|uniref:TrkH family potassium uptake protein n=1 Tax=Corticimicrobacter sp. TaxID=2678536 RepID=UPI0032DBA68C